MTDTAARFGTGRIQSGLEDDLATAVGALPRVGLFLLVLVVGLALAKVVAVVVTRVLQRVGIDRAAERGGIGAALSASRYDAAAVLGRVVFYFIFLAVLSLAFSVFGSANPVSLFLARITGYLPRLFVAGIAVVLASCLAAAVKDLLGPALADRPYGRTVSRGASLFVVAVGLFVALNELQVAPLIVGGVFYALLALIVVPPIIAFGVGGIEPARQAITALQGRAQHQAQPPQPEVAGDDEVPLGLLRASRNGTARGAVNGTARGAVNGTARGAVNGTAKGAANGTARGAVNGAAKSAANGTARGAANGTARGAGATATAVRTLPTARRTRPPRA